MASMADEPARSLGDSINISTRSVHTKLNKFILARLPLAIPPQAKDPSNYVSGLLHVTPIYHAFESAWQDILKHPAAEENPDVKEGHSCEACKTSSAIHHIANALDAPHRPVVCTRVHSLLQHVHTTDLERTNSLKQDIAYMTGWSPELLEEQIASASDSPLLSSFLQHISRSARDRPHVLLAYAWVLYMALFSGGRFIRASLSQIDPDFWTANLMKARSSKDADVLPLHFFTFNAPNDGDEIKLAFKKRLAESSTLLTDAEQADVVAEAKHIFEFMVETVVELDGVCRTEPEIKNEQDEGIMWRMSRLLGLRTRDSVVIAKERMAWAKLLDDRWDAEDFDESSFEEPDNSAIDTTVSCWHGKSYRNDKHLKFTEPERRSPGGSE